MRADIDDLIKIINLVSIGCNETGVGTDEAQHLYQIINRLAAIEKEVDIMRINMTYHYLKTTGDMEFPNNKEGDQLSHLYLVATRDYAV